MNTDDFIKKSIAINGNRYDYSKTIYNGSKEDVIITCPIHGDFKLKASNHLHKQYGCPKCGIELRASKRRLSLDDFIKLASTLHNNRYDYTKVRYVNMHQKVCIICPEHGEFWLTPQKHLLRKHGCPKCKNSFGELFIEKFLKDHNIDYIPQYTIEAGKELKARNRLYIDFYIPKYNTFIEYNGILHYVPVEFFGGKILFLQLQERDIYLRNYCNIRNINLIEISYKENIQNILERWVLDR